jgi:hypothetical protein
MYMPMPVGYVMDEKELIGVDILLPSEYFAVFQYLLHKK